MGIIRNTGLTRVNTSYSVSRYNEETGDFEFHHVHPLDESIDSIKERFTDLIESNQSLQKRLRELEDEKWADNAIQEMKTKYDQMMKDYYRGFPISEKEQAIIDAWMKDHIHPSGAIGGGHTYCFTPTGIGTFGEVRCSCGATLTFSEP